MFYGIDGGASKDSTELNSSEKKAPNFWHGLAVGAVSLGLTWFFCNTTKEGSNYSQQYVDSLTTANLIAVQEKNRLGESLKERDTINFTLQDSLKDVSSSYDSFISAYNQERKKLERELTEVRLDLAERTRAANNFAYSADSAKKISSAYEARLSALQDSLFDVERENSRIAGIIDSVHKDPKWMSYFLDVINKVYSNVDEKFRVSQPFYTTGSKVFGVNTRVGRTVNSYTSNGIVKDFGRVWRELSLIPKAVQEFADYADSMYLGRPPALNIEELGDICYVNSADNILWRFPERGRPGISHFDAAKSYLPGLRASEIGKNAGVWQR